MKIWSQGREKLIKVFYEKKLQKFIFSTPTLFNYSNDLKPALPPKKLRSNSTKFFPSPPESPRSPNDPNDQCFMSLTLPATPNNHHHMDELKTPTEMVRTPHLSSNESEMPCNNNNNHDIMNVENEEVILRKKPSESVSKNYDKIILACKLIYPLLRLH